jgi:hypothetical protein
VYCLCVILCILDFKLSPCSNVACNLLGCSPACGIHIHSPVKMEQTQCSETSVIKNHTPGKTPKDYTQHSVYRFCVFCVLFVYSVYYLCDILCIICVLFCVLFVCKCVPYCCHRVSTKLRLNIYIS